MYDSNQTVVHGLDFGFGSPAWVLLQIEPIFNDQAQTVRRIVHCLKEFTGHNIDIANFYEGTIKPWLEKALPRAKHLYYGDPAGNQKESTSGKSDMEVLAGLGIVVKSKAARVETTKLDERIGRINILQAIISAGDLQVDPVTCPKLLAALQGGYHRDDEGAIVKDGPDHICDATSYAIFNLFDIDKKALHGTDRVHRSFVQPTNQPVVGARHDANSQPGSPLTRPLGNGTTAGVRPAVHTQNVYVPARWDPRAPAKPRR